MNKYKGVAFCEECEQDLEHEFIKGQLCCKFCKKPIKRKYIEEIENENVLKWIESAKQRANKYDKKQNDTRRTKTNI